MTSHGGEDSAPQAQPTTDLAARMRGVLGRRWRALAAVAIAAAVMAVPLGVAGGWLLPAGGQAAAGFALGLWLSLTVAGVAVVVLVDRRPRRRVTLLTLAAVGGLMLCVVPMGAFWTFAVDLQPTGARTPTAAVVQYFAAGPLGGYARDDLLFGRTLCGARRGELRGQAERIAADITRATIGRGVSLFAVDTRSDRTTVDGTRSTVTTEVSLTFSYNERQGAGANFLQGAWHSWTFHLVDADGWRICQVDAPVICGVVVNCDPPPSATPGGPSPTEDPLRNPRDMLPCGPRDPFRELHNCPSGAPSPAPSTSPER